MSWSGEALGGLLVHSIGGVWGGLPGTDEEDVRVIRVTELKPYGVLDVSTAAHRSISSKQLAGRRLAEGDLLLEKSGGGPNTPVGRVGLVAATPPKSVCSNFMQLMRPNPLAIYPRFLHLYLNHIHAMGETIGMQTASTNIRNIKASDYMKVRVPVPTLDEQRRVVGILEEQLSDIDAGLSYLRAGQKLMAVLPEALLGEHLRDPSGNGVELSALIASPLTNGRSVRTREGGFPVLRLTAMRDTRIDLRERKAGDWGADQALAFLVKRGDFMVARGNGSLRLVGRGALVDDDPDEVAFPDTMIRVRPKTEVLDPHWLAFVWNSRSVRAQIEASARTSAGIYKVNQAQLSKIRVPMLSIEKQRDAVAALTSSALEIRRCLRAVDIASRRATTLRQGALSAAFAGRLTGRSSDTDTIEDLVGQETA